jgi:hypothetical protein
MSRKSGYRFSEKDMRKSDRARQALLAQALRGILGHQLPGRSWMPGKNRSFQPAGFCFSVPTLFMNSA